MTQKAFTLVELVISVAIMALIISMTFFNLNDYSDKKSLSNETELLQEKVGQLRSLALAGYQINATLPDCFGFAIADNNVDYYLYADMNNNFEFDAIDDEIIEKQTLSKNLLFKQSVFNIAEFCFKPYIFSEHVCVASGDCSEAIDDEVGFTLVNTKSNDETTIIVNKISGFTYLE